MDENTRTTGDEAPNMLGRGHWETDAGGFGLTLDGVEYTGEWKAEKEVLI